MTMCAQVTLKEDGFKGLAKGWAPTFLGYAAQVSQIQNNFSFLYDYNRQYFSLGYVQIWFV